MRYRSFFENAARWQLSHLSFKSRWIIFSIFLYGNQKFWLFCVLDMASLTNVQRQRAGKGAGQRRLRQRAQSSLAAIEQERGLQHRRNFSGKRLVCRKVQLQVNGDNSLEGNDIIPPKKKKPR